MPLSWFHWPKTPQPNLKRIFFILNYKTLVVITRFKQLSSSICCWVMAGQILPWRGNYAFSEKFWIRPKTGFSTHNFGYRYASKSMEGSIDADFDLVFNKILSQKNGSMCWCPGPSKGGQTFQNMPSLWRHIRNPPPKTKNVFFDFDYKTCWIRGWFG